MASLASINVRFSADLRQFSSEMQTALRQIDSAGQKFQKIGRSLSTYVTAPILAAGAASIKFAMDYEESLNKVDQAFKGSSAEVKDFAKQSLETSGIAEGTALDMAAAYGDMATSMGLTRAESAKMSTDLVTLAGDLASFKNISIDVANTALSSIFTGETESLKKMGIVMTEVNLIQFALNSGIKKGYKDMSQAEKVQLRYNYVLSVTKNAQGDFARTSGGAANQTRIFQESLKQIAQQFGAIILPAFTKLITGVNGLIKKFGELSEPTKRIIVVVAGLVAAIGPLLVVIGGILAIIPSMVAGFALVSTAMTGLMASVAPVLAGIVLLWGAYMVLRDRSKEAANATIELTESQKLIQKVTDEASASIVDQKSKLELLLLTARNENESKAERLRAIQAINKISPEYLGNLTLENINTDKARASIEKYNQALLSGATARAASRLLEQTQTDKIKAGFDREKALADYNEKRKEAMAKGWEAEKAFYEENNRILQFANEALDRKNSKYDRESKLLLEIYQKNKDNLKLLEETERMQDVVAEGEAKKPEDIDPLVVSIKTTISAGTIEAYDAQIAKLKQYRNEVATTAQQIESADKAIKSLEFGKALVLDPTSLITTTLTTEEMVERLKSSLSAAQSALEEKATRIKEVGALVSESVANMFGALGNSIVDSLGLTESAFGRFASSMLKTLVELAQIVIKQIIINQAASMSNAISGATAAGSATGPAAPFTTPVFIGTAIAGVLAAFAAIPKFETGGVVGGNSLYGDKILARLNSKELVLNTSQQANLYGRLNSNSTAIFIPNVKLVGSDFLIMFERAQAKKKRLG